MPKTLSPDYFESTLPPGKEWFTPGELARLLGCSDQFIRDHFDSQEILGHTLCSLHGRREIRRRIFRIPRRAVLLHLAETCNHEGRDFEERVLRLIDGCPRPLRERILRTALTASEG